MFNVGGMELVAVGVVALVVLGPDRLPGAVRQIGSMLGQLRRISRGFQVDLDAAIADVEREAEPKGVPRTPTDPERLAPDPLPHRGGD